MRKLPFGRPETIVGSSPPLNPNSYSSHSTNSPPAKRSCSTMKGLFKTKPRSPPELVRHLRELLNFINRREHKKEKHREEKMSDLDKCILEMRTILYGIDGAEPVAEACAQLTMEFLKDDTVCVLIDCLPKLDLGARQNATRVITNLSRQRIDSRLIVAEYLENNMDLMNILILGYEDSEIALSYGPILRECIRCQTVARYLLESAQMKNFFYYVQNPNFEIASDAAATFKELLTRHKSTVAEFLSKNFDWFFHEYNSQLLQSTNYITRRHAVKLLGDMLLDRSNSAVMIRYVSSLDNMRILMNLLKEPNKSIQLESFHVFKLFVANQNKPPEIVGILLSNRSKLLRFLSDFNMDKEDEQFESDKAQVVQLIINLNQQADDEER